jgi:hypothetical protein
MNPPQQQRKAFQTAEGFNRTHECLPMRNDVIPKKRRRRTCRHTEAGSD